MDFFLNLLINGVSLGAIYALVAVGFVLIVKCSRVFNIAHGSIVLVGAYLAWSLLVQFGLPLWLSIVLIIAAGACLGLVIERLTIRHLIGQPILAPLMLTIALIYVIEGGVLLIWSAEFRAYTLPGVTGTIMLGNLPLPRETVVTLGISVMVIALFVLFFQYTRQGLSMRACAEDEQVAQSCGIRVSTVYALTWATACVVALLGGALLGSFGGANLGISSIGLKAFAVALLGGVESIPGAIVAGLIVGVLESIAAGYLDPLLPAGGGLAGVFPFIVMIMVLVFKPYGLFGLVRIERI